MTSNCLKKCHSQMRKMGLEYIAGLFQIFCYFHPEPCGRFQFHESYFSNGLVKHHQLVVSYNLRIHGVLVGVITALIRSPLIHPLPSRDIQAWQIFSSILSVGHLEPFGAKKPYSWKMVKPISPQGWSVPYVPNNHLRWGSFRGFFTFFGINPHISNS